MKICHPCSSGKSVRKRFARALTLVEMMVSMSVFSLVVMALVYGHIFGLRQDELVNSKLGATDMSRQSFQQMTREIRSAKMWRIGTGSASGFNAIPNGTLQQGNALQLHHGTDTNDYVRYFFDLQRRELCRSESGTLGHQVIAQDLTNTMFFRAEDYLGNPKTDLSYKYVIRVMMEFCQFQYPLTKVGPGYFYDYYKLEFRITPHCPDGA